jgi:heteromeric Ino2p/Ino4p transcription factor
MIRSSFDRLVELVPDLDESESRSELAILDKTSKYIEELRAENDRLEQLRKRSVE